VNARGTRTIRIPVRLRCSGLAGPADTSPNADRIHGPAPGLSFTDNRNGTAVIAETSPPGSNGRYRVTVTATNASGKLPGVS
jgi:hypothetical protein